MRWLTRLPTLLLCGLVCFHSARAADPQPAKPKSDPAEVAASKAIDEALADYQKAYAAGDADGVMKHWTDDADFIDFRARRHDGKDAIADLFRRAFDANVGRQIKLIVSKRTFLSPDSAMDDGVLELIGADGNIDRGRYVTIWTKVDGKWLIRSVRDMPPDPEPAGTTVDDPLAGVAFLAGKWTADRGESTVEIDCDWRGDRSFLVQEYRVVPKAKSDDAKDLTVWIWIGWDPIEQIVRSWVFDSNGGFGEGTWQRRDDAWKINAVGILPDGGTGSSTYLWEKVDHDTLGWAAHDREVNGEGVADVELKFTRRK